MRMEQFRFSQKQTKTRYSGSANERRRVSKHMQGLAKLWRDWDEYVKGWTVHCRMSMACCVVSKIQRKNAAGGTGARYDHVRQSLIVLAARAKKKQMSSFRDVQDPYRRTFSFHLITLGANVRVCLFPEKWTATKLGSPLFWQTSGHECLVYALYSSPFPY